MKCPNMNHGRWQVSIKYCPTCGEIVNKEVRKPCNGTEHPKRRKNRDQFCIDCGKSLG